MSFRVFDSLESAAGQFGPCALAIGNFDGVHVGHQALLRRVCRHAQERGLEPAALTFHPHPAAVLAPEKTPLMLCSLAERVRLLQRFGMRRVLVLPFTTELSHCGPREFVEQVVVQALEARAVAVGENFRFGYRQSGDTKALAQLGNEFGFVSEFLPPVRVRGELVSSSAIRRHLGARNVVRAGRLLGRCFSVAGRIVAGQGIGREQTVPTLNLRPEPGLAFPLGVFVTETVEMGGSQRRWPSITNVGTRPTFGGSEVTIETFLLGALDGATPAEIEVDFRHFVRAERSFANPGELKAQIGKDVGRANSYWRRVSRFRIQP